MKKNYFLRRNEKELRELMKEFRDKEKVIFIESTEDGEYVYGARNILAIPEFRDTEFQTTFMDFIERLITLGDMRKAYEELATKTYPYREDKKELEILKKVRNFVVNNVERILVIEYQPYYSCIAIKLK